MPSPSLDRADGYRAPRKHASAVAACHSEPKVNCCVARWSGGSQSDTTITMTESHGKRVMRVPDAGLSLLLRWSSAVIFVVFGAGKFLNHASEVASFRQYRLPYPERFVYAIGALEIVGGLLLLSGRLVRLAALALAGDMVGAIVVSGIDRGRVHQSDAGTGAAGSDGLRDPRWFSRPVPAPHWRATRRGER